MGAFRELIAYKCIVDDGGHDDIIIGPNAAAAAVTVTVPIVGG